MKRYLTFLLSVILSLNTIAQDLVKAFDETLTVNSKSNYGGNSHNIGEVKLPPKTIAIIYRVTIFKKGAGIFDSELYETLKQFGSSKVALATSFAEYAIKSNDNEAVDINIFNNVYDATEFHQKKEGWTACKSQANRINCCVKTSDFLTNRIFFGFKNNNYMQGLDVRLEVVAVVDTNLNYDYKYTYQISNETDRELTFSLSGDGQKWVNYSLRNGYTLPLNTEQNVIYFVIQTDDTKKSQYKLQPNERFKIIHNKKELKWDLMKY